MHLSARVLFAFLAAFGVAAAGERWPQFRGPDGQGHAEAKSPALRFGDTENVKWKTPIHGRGWSSPVVWDGQIWLTTATPDGKRLSAVCVALDTGKVIHDILVFEGHEPEPINALNSYASPTPVIEDGRVYLHFGTYGTACLSTRDGQVLWQRQDLKCNHFRGPGSSPVLDGDRLFLHYDGFDVQYVVALNKRDGKTLWRADRSTDFKGANGDFRKAFSTPLVVPRAAEGKETAGGRNVLISAGSKAVMGYDLATGDELWKFNMPAGYSSSARPVLCGGRLLVASGFGKSELFCLRLAGHGQLGDDDVAWKVSKGVCQKTSPLAVGDLVFVMGDAGVLSCLDGQTGDTVWQQRLRGEYSASPLSAAGRVYVFAHDGRVTVFAPERQYRELAVNQLEDGFMASPAVVGNSLILRTKTHLYRIDPEAQ